MRAIHAPVEPLLSGLGLTSRGLSSLSLSLSLSRIHHYHLRPAPATFTSAPYRRWHSSALAETRRQRFQHGVEALLAALRQHDTVKLYFCLMDLTRGVIYNNRDFCAAVYQIPVTTFSEIIHALDPFTVCRDIDSTSGLRISYGAAVHTPLGELISKWGVKIVYVRIMNRLNLIARARRREAVTTDSRTKIHLLPNDYMILIRCAGAISDIVLAKSLYRQMKPKGYANWIHSEMYTDFIKAAYLTEALYTRHDFSAVRLRPLDMHLDLAPSKIRRLRGVETAVIVHQPGSRFGQMVRKRHYAESVRKILKLKAPLEGMMKVAIRPAMTIVEDEHLVCALIKAKGRHGDLDGIKELLQRYWGIKVQREKTIEGKMIHRIGGGYTDIPASSCIAPTEALLEAVVHGYGNSGEAQLAGDLMQYISNIYAIPIPNQVWSDLLSYARIHRARPAKQEWLIAGMRHKITHRDYIYEIWQTATQPPHNFNPRIEDYMELLKEQVGREKMVLFQEWNLELIRQVKILYLGLTKDLQNAWASLIHTTRQGVPNHAAYRRFRMLQSRKHYTWHGFHYTAQRALKHITPFRLDDPRAVKIIPDLILELQEFLPTVVKYRIATGIVKLRLDHIVWQDKARVPGISMIDDMDDLGLRLEDLEDDADEGEAEQWPEDELADEENDVEDDEVKEDGEDIADKNVADDHQEETLHVKILRKNRLQIRHIERPAFGRRPKPIAPAGEVSHYSLKQQGKVFRGYEHEPDFAARDLALVMRRARGTPVNLDWGQSPESIMEQLVKMRR